MFRVIVFVKRHVRLAILPLTVSLAAGCVPTPNSPYILYPQYEPASRQVPVGTVVIPGFEYRAHPQYDERSRSITTVATMPPVAKVYSRATSGRDLMDEWSETARKNLGQAMAKQVGPQGRLTLKQFDPTWSPAAQQEYEDIRPLFEAVALSALAHAYQIGRASCRERVYVLV